MRSKNFVKHDFPVDRLIFIFVLSNSTVVSVDYTYMYVNITSIEELPA
jgi:hypothetical protein